MASTLKIDTVTTPDGTGNIAFSRPIVADVSNVTGTLPAIDGSNLTGILPAVGSSGNVLTSDGSNWASTAPAGGGTWTVLTSTNITSTTASVEFTSGIDATYRTYVVHFEGVNGTVNIRGMRVALGDSSGFDTASADYAHTGRYSYDSTAGSQQGGNTDMVDIQGIKVGSASGSNMSGQITFTRPTDGASFPQLRWSAGSYNHSSQATEGTGNGVRKSAITVDRIKLILESSSFTKGRFTLYGIAHA